MLEEKEDTRTQEAQPDSGASSNAATSRVNLRRVFINKWSVRIYAFVIFILVWQIIGETLNPIIFSPPGVVAIRFAQLTADSTIPSDTLVTLQTVVFGFIPAVAIGIPIGLLIGRSKTTEYALDPYVSFIYAIPIIVMIPILVVWIGSNLFSSYILVFIAGVFPVVINSIAGAKNVRATLVETGRSFGYGGSGLWRKIIFPGSLPYVMAGLRIGVGHAVIGAILAEIFMYTVGLGFLIEDGSSLFDTPEVISAVIVTIFLGIFLTELVKVFERRVSIWSATEASE